MKKKPSTNLSEKKIDFGRFRPDPAKPHGAPIRLPKINKTHADTPQKDNIQEDNLKEDYPKEPFLHETQTTGQVH